MARATPQITKFCLMRFVNCWAGSVPLRPGLMDVLRVLMTCYSFLWLAWLKGRTKTGMVCLTAWSKASPKPSAKVGAARPGKTTGPEPQTWGQIAQASQRFLLGMVLSLLVTALRCKPAARTILLARALSDLAK